MDILVQPMQRLTKYGLLLKAILKNTDDDIERESLNSMVKLKTNFENIRLLNSNFLDKNGRRFRKQRKSHPETKAR